jgi:hypothetical protein
MRAAALERAIGRLVDVTVINSEEGLRRAHPGWLHLGNDAYFSAQWNAARRVFDGDAFFHIQADARCSDFGTLFRRASRVFARHRVGVYEPDVDHTDFRFDVSKLAQVGRKLYRVPLTDCTCWFILGCVLSKVPKVDDRANRLGWGITDAVAATSRSLGLSCVRDYTFQIQHPRARGYSSKDASAQRAAFLMTLPANLKRGVLRQRRELAQLCGFHQSYQELRAVLSPARHERGT